MLKRAACPGGNGLHPVIKDLSPDAIGQIRTITGGTEE
jgi:hypothetical protein